VTRLLLDTQLVLWWLNGDARLPPTVVQRVQAPEVEVFVSQASLWEMAIKVSIGRLQVDLPELERQVPLQGFRWLPISNAHLLAVAELETDGVHRDPFARLLVCQSRVEPMLLLSVDSRLRSHGTTVIVT
jgi:PIN domain nuclease of toxin-antitoxin system